MKLINDNLKVKINGNLIDLVDEFELKKDLHYKKTLNLWGKNNHKGNKKKHDGYDTHIEKVLLEFPIDKQIENFLEIGCGEGNDLNYILKNYNIKNAYALEIGENIYEISKQDIFKNVFFFRSDCLDLRFKNNSFDLIYSYGVFHHTKSLKKSLFECKRVLKNNGVLIFYNYIKHKNVIKKYGTLVENCLLKIFNRLEYKIVKLICYLISPIILMLFSYPAQLLKLLGSKKIYKQIPLWWGMSPKNIILDLTDRLYAPVNIRMSKEEMETLLSELGFSFIDVKEVRDGLFCKVIK